MQRIVDLLSNEILTNLIVLLFTSYAGYKVAKLTSLSERSIEVLKNQFNLLYLPLHKKYRKAVAKNIDRDTEKEYYNDIYKTAYENYEFVHPKMFKLLDEIEIRLENDKYCDDIFDKLFVHIRDTTVKIRKKLGYPTMNIFETLLFMRDSVKMLFISYSLFLLLYFEALIFSIFNLKVEGDVAYIFGLTGIFIVIFLFLSGLLYFFEYIGNRYNQRKYKKGQARNQIDNNNQSD